MILVKVTLQEFCNIIHSWKLHVINISLYTNIDLRKNNFTLSFPLLYL